VRATERQAPTECTRSRPRLLGERERATRRSDLASSSEKREREAHISKNDDGNRDGEQRAREQGDQGREGDEGGAQGRRAAG